MITLITGDHPRHKYLVDCFVKIFPNVTWIIQKREKFYPTINESFSADIQRLHQIHFQKRQDAEYKFFSKKAGNLSMNKINQIFQINGEDFVNGKLKLILNRIKSKILITYGCEKIPKDILRIIKCHKWNIHGGLSPWYRGTITHFWPSYMLEPEYTGMTLHELTNEIDGGDIVHQSSVNLNPNDGIHENACRVVKNFSNKLPMLVKTKIKKKLIPIKLKSTGRIWTSKMWNPLLLNTVYNVFEDKINKYCLENKKIIKPKLKSILI
tara:strand:- start:2090 stop:2890 length:801 start_codon:yes stop_codon:yes gene_type:complete